MIMSNVIGLLERLATHSGVDQDKESMVRDAVAKSEISPEIADALSRGDQQQLVILLGATANVCCMVLPSKEDGDEDQEKKQDDDDDAPDEGTEKGSRDGLRRVALAR